jgi:hypothetical protein
MGALKNAGTGWPSVARIWLEMGAAMRRVRSATIPRFSPETDNTAGQIR